MNSLEFANKMIDFIDKSPCSYFAIENMANILLKEGFEEIDLKKDFKLKAGSKAFIKNNDSALIAFTIGSEDIEEKGFKIIGSHSDSPGFRIKSNPMMKSSGTLKLNTEVYGGPILSTWFDRPLSIAGRVVVKGKDLFEPEVKLLNIDRDLLIIPNLAIHMNREVNKGFELNPQVHTLPIIGLDTNKELDKEILNKLIAEELKISVDDLLDYDLYLYDRAKGSILGINNDLISVGRLDNLAMAYTSIKALIDTEASGVNIMVCTDNEEVGSRSIQGADSPMIDNTLERISLALGKSREDYLRAIESSYMVSSDMAHAIHPNFEDKADPTNKPVLGGGPVIKYAANKAYTSDAYSASIFKELCKQADVACQTFHNRSDIKGGSTIGPITASQLNIRSVDIGGPMLSMHSIKELCQVEDSYAMYKVFKELYK
ncbi:MAG: M18 family aminopeptidase [Peptoniphilaceae bacterium]